MKNAVTVPEAQVALVNSGFDRVWWVGDNNGYLEVKKGSVCMDLPVLNVDGVPCVHMVTTKRRFESTEKLVFWCNAVVKAVSACIPKAEKKADWDIDRDDEDWLFSPND